MTPPQTDEFAAFINAARTYCLLLRSYDSDAENWVSGILQALSKLYAAALQLPRDVDAPVSQTQPSGDDDPIEMTWDEVSLKEWNETQNLNTETFLG